MSEIADLYPTVRQDVTPFYAGTRHHRRIQVERYPVCAEKDRKVPANNASPEHLGGELRELATKLLPLIRILLPHSWLPDKIYLKTAFRVCSESEITAILTAGCKHFQHRLGCDIAAASPAALHGLLQSSENDPFFRMLLNRSIRHLYDDPAVWAGCGYEGVHGCRGQDQRDGIADATWLPEPAE